MEFWLFLAFAIGFIGFMRWDKARMEKQPIPQPSRNTRLGREKEGERRFANLSLGLAAVFLALSANE
jgi:hypothetical protein